MKRSTNVEEFFMMDRNLWARAYELIGVQFDQRFKLCFIRCRYYRCCDICDYGGVEYDDE